MDGEHAMKITIEEAKQTHRDVVFPCLMRVPGTEHLVLFSSHGVGVSLGCCLGFAAQKWEMDKFVPLPRGSKVVLTQE